MYASPLAAAWSHLPGRKGTASGIIISGFGFGGFIFGNVSHHLCNPDNLSVEPYVNAAGHKMNLFPDSVAERVPFMMRSLASIWLGLFVIGLLCISKYDGVLYNEHQDAKVRPEINTEVDDAEQALEEYSEEHLPVVEILKSKKFGLLYLLAICHFFYGYYMQNSYKQFGFSGGIDDRTLTRIGSFGALFNGCFKIFWASLLDYYPFKRCYLILVAIQFMMLIWVHWAVYSDWQFFIVICLSYMCDGSLTSMLPVVTL